MQSLVVSQITTEPHAWTLPGYTTTKQHHATTKFRRLSPVSAVTTPSLCPQVAHSMPPAKVEVFKSLESWASQWVLPLLKPVDKCWQPNDFLPDPSQPSDDFIEQVRALQERTFGLPDDYFVTLVGNMITEDGLPTFMISLSTLDEVCDKTGCSSTPWATWTREWAAEESRHGNLLRTYLYLSGRVDMQMIERTMQYLIGAGGDFGAERNPYMGFVYTSFQERAGSLLHGNTARLAKEGGDLQLAKICGTIASDEKRHEIAYTRIVEKLVEVDPNEIMLAIANMMRKTIKMPAHLMYDGQDAHLYGHFSAVTQRLGIYTVSDYADILQFLIGRWRLEKLEGLTGEGKHAQEFVCGLPPRIRKLQERADERARKLGPRGQKFSWIFNKEVTF